jgi:hypothetical protein
MGVNDHDDEDAHLELTPAERLQSLAELLVIGLQRLRKRPQIPPETPILLPQKLSEFHTNELALGPRQSVHVHTG